LLVQQTDPTTDLLADPFDQPHGRTLNAIA